MLDGGASAPHVTAEQFVLLGRFVRGGNLAPRSTLFALDFLEPPKTERGYLTEASFVKKPYGDAGLEQVVAMKRTGADADVAFLRIITGFIFGPGGDIMEDIRAEARRLGSPKVPVVAHGPVPVHIDVESSKVLAATSGAELGESKSAEMLQMAVGYRAGHHTHLYTDSLWKVYDGTGMMSRDVFNPMHTIMGQRGGQLTTPVDASSNREVYEGLLPDVLDAATQTVLK